MGCTPGKTLFQILQFYLKCLCQFAFCANIHSCLFSFYIYLPSGKKKLTFFFKSFDLIDSYPRKMPPTNGLRSQTLVGVKEYTGILGQRAVILSNLEKKIVHYYNACLLINVCMYNRIWSGSCFQCNLPLYPLVGQSSQRRSIILIAF